MKKSNPKTDGFIGEFEQLSEEQTGIRILETEDGKRFDVISEDPHGLFRIISKKGRLPERLEGHWTSLYLAEKAIERYLND